MVDSYHFENQKNHSMNKKHFLTALLFCGIALTASAQESKLNVLYVDGSSHEVQMSAVARLTVTDGTVNLLGKEGETVASHQVAKVDKIELTGSATAIAPLAAKQPVTIRSNGYTITAVGIADGEWLEVYTTDGSLVAKSEAHDGTAVVDAHNLADGVYVVKAGRQSLKMVKR